MECKALVSCICLSAGSLLGVTIPANAGIWNYSEKIDEMRNSTIVVASTESTNQVQMKRSLGRLTSLFIDIYQEGSSHFVMLRMPGEMFKCTEYYLGGGCSFFAKFDNGPVKNIKAAFPASDVLDYIQLFEAESFIKQLRRSKKIILEVYVFGEGKFQFTFEPETLTLP